MNDLQFHHSNPRNNEKTAPIGPERQNYVYHSLVPLGTHAVRLLDLELTSESASQIRCSLRQVDLREVCGKYATLSYTWGSTYSDGSHLTDVIICNDAGLKVTRNLHQALKHLRQYWHGISVRHGGTFCTIWADAVCINQSDVRERSHQVGLMGAIFRGSAQTYAWLGEPGSLARHPLWPRLTPSLAWDDGPEEDEEEGDQHCGRWAEVVSDLMERSWWTRLWVVQEFLLSSSVLFMIGDRLLPLHAVQALVPGTTAATAGHRWTARLPESQPLLRAVESRGVKLHIIRNLIMHSNAECYVPHDRIFGMLAISASLYFEERDLPRKPQVEPKFVDYNTPYLETYRQAIVASIRHDLADEMNDVTVSNRALHDRAYRNEPSSALVIPLLVHASVRNYHHRRCSKGSASIEQRAEPKATVEAPSWVPDWSLEPQFRSYTHKYAYEECQAWCVTTHYSSNGRRSDTFVGFDNDYSMRLRGWLFISSDFGVDETTSQSHGHTFIAKCLKARLRKEAEWVESVDGPMVLDAARSISSQLEVLNDCRLHVFFPATVVHQTVFFLRSLELPTRSFLSQSFEVFSCMALTSYERVREFLRLDTGPEGITVV